MLIQQFAVFWCSSMENFNLPKVFKKIINTRNLKGENIVIEHNKKVTNKIYKERKRTVNITSQHLN